MHGGLRECGTIGETQVIEFVRFRSEEAGKESREVNRGPGAKLPKPWGVTDGCTDDTEDVQDTMHFGSRKEDILERKEMVRDDTLERRNEMSLSDM